MNLSFYKTFVFDCDGVLLDSNRIKTEAFRSAAIPYGEGVAEALVEHKEPLLQELLSDFAETVKKGLMRCDVAKGLTALREMTAKSRWMIVSGSDQNELRDIFALRGLDNLFDGGIFGSPEGKNDIVKRELELENITQPALFFGDSRLDHQVAMHNGIDFVFVSKWSEFVGWEEYCRFFHIPVIDSLSKIIA